ncbi:MAG: type II toxin-antitoxin system prevent-host-death family antitoxin [Terracidiphilus sp.]|jgi:prevent-host-death family protein
MRTINIHQAKTHLSRLVDEAVQGDSFIIAKAGKPKVRVVRIDESIAQPKRLLGAMKGLYSLPENFEEIDREMDKEIERLFLGEDAQ